MRPKKEPKYFDVSDVQRAEFNLEPLKCRKCGSTKNVVYLQYVGDAQCEKCGAWQGEYTKAGHKRKKLRDMA